MPLARPLLRWCFSCAAATIVVVLARRAIADEGDVSARRHEAAHYVSEADKKDGAEARALYEKGGLLYYKTFREHCEEPVMSGQEPAPRCDELAFNASHAFSSARNAAKAITAGLRLIAFNDTTRQGSNLAIKVEYELASAYQTLALYDLSADRYERYAKHPNEPKADVALTDAVLLRLGMGQEDAAAADAQAFVRSYGATKPAQTAQLMLAMAAHHGERAEWEKVRSVLLAWMPAIDKASPDLAVRGHALLARAYARVPTPARGQSPSRSATAATAALAKQEYATVMALWSDPEAALQKIHAAWASEEGALADRRLARALTAVGEAYFAAAEERRQADVESLTFPAYPVAGAGGADEAHVLAHLQTKVRPWFEKKRAAIESVERDYVKILEITPVPPPIWVVAAGARVGLMWANFADDFRRAPVPGAFTKSVRTAYDNAIDAASEPVKIRYARPATKKCLDLAVKYQVVDERTRGCEVWLAKNYKAEYHLVDEVVPPIFFGSARTASPVLLRDGSLWSPK